MPTKPSKAQQKRTAVYLRISKDPDGTQDATERQLADCRKYADLHRLDVVDVFEDVDLSAYRKGVVRPQYLEMLEAMREGAYDVVLVWRIDRLVRRTVEFADFWSIAEENNIDLKAAAQPIDTSDAVGKMVVDILVAFAEMESATISARMKSKEEFLAKAGVHKGAGRRAYGLAAGWQEIVPEEAAVIRDVAERLIAGETVSGIVRDLNAREVPSATGRKWNRRSLTVLMQQARLFGWREHHGELTAKGDWPAIIDERTGHQLRKLLTPRKGAGGTFTRRRYLLSGLLRCGKCDGRMKSGRRSGGRLYTCNARTDGGCSGTTVVAEAADEAVCAMALHRLDSPDLARTLRARKDKHRTNADADLLAELGELSDRADEAAEDYASGALDRAGYQLARRAIEERTEEINLALAEIQQSEPLAGIIEGEGGLRTAWETMSTDRKRAVLDVILERVVVHNAGSPYFAERLHESLLAEADEAEEAGDMALAKRRRKQAENRNGGGGSFRPERLEPVWRV